MAVYNACVLSTLLYGSETWITYARQEKRLNTCQVRSIRRVLGISWQDKVTNVEVLSRAGLTTVYTLLRQPHVRPMEDSRIPKDILHGELVRDKEASAARNLRFKDVCKRDMRALNIHTESWEDLAADCGSWRNAFHKQLKLGEKKLTVMVDEEWAYRKDPTTRDCNRDCHSLIDLFSHRQRCSSRADSLDGSTHGWPWLMGAY